jgi:hypothetical protein
MLFSSGLTFAQYPMYPRYEHWYLGLQLGSSNFYGDISERSSAFSGGVFNNRKFMYGATFTKKFNALFGTRLNLLTGVLSDASEDLSLQFKSEVVEISALGYFGLTGAILGDDYDRPYDVFLYVGAGMLGHRTWKRDLLLDTLTETDGTGRKSSKAFMIPMGVVAEYRLASDFTITAEFTLRNVQTDRLDAHSSLDKNREGYGYIALGMNYQFDMPEGIFRRNSRHTGRSSDPALKAYNRKKKTVMKTRGYREGQRDKRRYQREKKDWLIFRIFKRSRIEMATE